MLRVVSIVRTLALGSDFPAIVKLRNSIHMLVCLLVWSAFGVINVLKETPGGRKGQDARREYPNTHIYSPALSSPTTRLNTFPDGTEVVKYRSGNSLKTQMKQNVNASNRNRKCKMLDKKN